jgi:hypothetical protein
VANCVRCGIPPIEVRMTSGKWGWRKFLFHCYSRAYLQPYRGGNRAGCVVTSRLRRHHRRLNNHS